MAAKQKQQAKQAPAKTPARNTRPAVAAPVLTATFQRGFWRDNWIPALLLMVSAFLLYGISISYGYMLDDQLVIWQNAYVQKGFAGLGDIFAYDSFMGYFQKQQFLLEGGRYRSLSLATFAAEIGIFGKDNPNLVHISHFINILLYGATGIFLYRILLGLFPSHDIRLRHRCSSTSLRISLLHVEFHPPLPNSSQAVSNAIPRLSPGLSHLT